MTKAYLDLCNQHDTLGTSFDELSHEFTAFRATADSRIRDAKNAARKSSNKYGVEKRRAKVYEQTSALLPDFPYDPQNVQWVGGSFDFIVYEGRVKDTDPVTIVFVEVKTGKSDLVARQKRIKEAVDSGRVRFEIYQPDISATQ